MWGGILLLHILTGTNRSNPEQTMKHARHLLLISSFFIFGLTSQVSAHEPSLHGFKLTTFDPPFPAPAFVLETLAGTPSKLEDFQGKYVLLNFWATWCPPCLEEMPSMELAYQHYKEKGFTVLAVSSDEEGKTAVSPFIEKLGVTFPILLDPDLAVSKVYGAINLPLSFLLNPQGQVIAGSEGGRDWASEEAFSVLDELIVPQN